MEAIEAFTLHELTCDRPFRAVSRSVLRTVSLLSERGLAANRLKSARLRS